MKEQKYRQAVDGVLNANPEAALHHTRELRQEVQLTPDQQLEQKLLSFRLSIKLGHAANLNENDLNPGSGVSVFLRAEAHFLQGIVLMHKNKFSEAMEKQQAAAEAYLQAEQVEKSLLSRFNIIIAKGNAGLLTPQQELKECADLWLQGEEHKLQHIQALCLRQKSYAYFHNDRFLAALCEIEEALPLIEATCPISDYHLALVHAADCAFETGDVPRTRQLLDYLPDATDSRVDFPKAYVMAKLHDQVLNLAVFPQANPHWLGRYQSYVQRKKSETAPLAEKLIWNTQTHWLMSSRKQILGKIKPLSLEGAFLKILMKGPASKELISEALWPEYAEVENLDDRFFRLKNRLQQKLGAIVDFDGKNYFLTVEIVWRTPS